MKVVKVMNGRNFEGGLLSTHVLVARLRAKGGFFVLVLVIFFTRLEFLLKLCSILAISNLKCAQNVIYKCSNNISFQFVHYCKP